jgi:hypothetical protein
MKKTLDKSTLVKNMSRATFGTVATTRVVPNAKDKAAHRGSKHPKRDLEQEDTFERKN